MRLLRKAKGAKHMHLSSLLLILFFPLAALVSCSQPPPPFVSLNLGIPAAALKSPVVGSLPDSTVLHVGITFKIDPQVLNVAAQQPLRPGQSSDLERFAKSLGVSDVTYQKIADFFNVQGLVLKLSKLRTYLSLQAKAGTFARLLQTKFVIHQYQGRKFYAPSTPPKIPSFLANSIVAVTGLDNYSPHPKHALQMNQIRRTQAPHSGVLDCNPGDQSLTPTDVAHAYGYDILQRRGLHGEQMAINLVEIDGSYVDDVQNYMGCIHYQGHLSVFNVDGAPSDAQSESTLDIEMAAGLLPAPPSTCTRPMTMPTGIPGRYLDAYAHANRAWICHSSSGKPIAMTGLAVSMVLGARGRPAGVGV